jgi:hypothetical protein
LEVPDDALNISATNDDEIVESLLFRFSVIPAEAGIQ